MKLLMTCDAVGGVWQYATDLADALAGLGVEVVLATMGPAPAGSPRSDVIDTGLPLDWLASGPAEVIAAGRAIAALAAAHRADLVQLNSPALAAAGPFGVPVVAVAHGCVGTWTAALGEEPGPDLAWHVDLVGRGLRAADLIAAPSAAYAAAVQRRYGLPSAPRVVHNGRRAPSKAPASAPADHVLTVGRLWDRAKRTDLLDRVAALLPVPMRAAGPVTAPHGETVAPRHLRLTGVLSDETLAAQYAPRPIFVSAAAFEPFGLAALEAAGAGCPLILSDLYTFRELWSEAALFVAGDDPAVWAAAIERVRADRGLREQLGDAARARAARYTPQACATAMLDLYRSLHTPERVAA